MIGNTLSSKPLSFENLEAVLERFKAMIDALKK
jgi:hypothetical protein